MDAMNIVGGIRNRLLNGIAALQGLCDICDGEAQYLEVVMDVEVGITSDAEETRRRDDEAAIAELRQAAPRVRRQPPQPDFGDEPLLALGSGTCSVLCVH